MKTLTEFQAPQIKAAVIKKQELVTAGKTAEEIPPLMSESLKIEGDRLTCLLNALEIIQNKTNDIKRIVVYTLEESEIKNTPKNVIDGKYFSAEYYPPLVQKKPQGKGRPFGKGPRGKKKRFGRRNNTRSNNNNPLNADGKSIDRTGEKKPGFDPNRRRRPWRGKPQDQNQRRTPNNSPRPETAQRTASTDKPARVHVPIEPPVIESKPATES